MSVIKGLRTIIYHVDDIEKAKTWYSKALEIEPYFDQLFYVGFNIGGFELGLDPDMSNVSLGNNQVAYWGVKEIKSSLKYLLDAGGKINSEIQDVGNNILTATIIDPFGNIFGLIQNPHFKFEEIDEK
jgi:predicted enzyme related to lactoylglutathione lyase